MSTVSSSSTSDPNADNMKTDTVSYAGSSMFITASTDTSSSEKEQENAFQSDNDKKSTTDLMFINHSGKTLSETSRPDISRREINRRVQQISIQKRRQDSLKRLKTAPITSQRPLARRPIAEKAYDVVDDGRRKEHRTRTPIVERSVSMEVGSINSYLNSKRMDPFNTGTMQMSSNMENLFTYYFTVIMPAVEPIQSEREDYNSWILPLAISEPALMYSMLATMAYDIEQASDTGFGPIAKRSRVSERVQYKIKAVQSLNHQLADEKLAAKPSTLIAVHFLLWQEIFAGDECVHIEGVRRLLELRGGFDGLQRKAIEAIMVGSYWRAIMSRTKPIIPMLPDHLSIPTDRFTSTLSTCDPSLSRIGEALLSDPAITTHFTPDFLSLLHDNRRLWILFERIHEFPADEKRAISIRRVNIDHRLLSYPFDHFDSSDRPYQEVIRQALVIYSNAHYNVVQPISKIAQSLIADLKRSLERTNLRNCWGDAHAVLMWVLFLGAHLTAGQRERPWFITALARVALLLSVPNRDWMRVRAVLVGFYYVDRVFQESWRRVWEEVDLLASVLPGWF